MVSHKRFADAMSQFVRKFTVRDRNDKFCYGVTLTQCYTLDSIANHKKMTMQSLSGELGLAISTITRVVDILVRDGFINRYHGEKDRRNVYVELTDKGKEMAGKLKDCSEQFWLGIFNRIPKNKGSRMIEDIELLHNILEDLPKELRTALLLREIEGMTYDEIANVMECPVGTIRSRIYRARELVEKNADPKILDKY